MENEHEQENEQESESEYAIKCEETQSEYEQFIAILDTLEDIDCVYQIEHIGYESSEQEYLMYIADHCKELRELINKLYYTKLYIMKAVHNNIELRREDIGL
jgi:hypothetical protein